MPQIFNKHVLDQLVWGVWGLGEVPQAPAPTWPCVPRQDCNTSLVRACWNELFTLGLAQCAQVMSLSTILAAIVNHLQNSIQEGRAGEAGKVGPAWGSPPLSRPVSHGVLRLREA